MKIQLHEILVDQVNKNGKIYTKDVCDCIINQINSTNLPILVGTQGEKIDYRSLIGVVSNAEIENSRIPINFQLKENSVFGGKVFNDMLKENIKTGKVYATLNISAKLDENNKIQKEDLEVNYVSVHLKREG